MTDRPRAAEAFGRGELSSALAPRESLRWGLFSALVVFSMLFHFAALAAMPNLKPRTAKNRTTEMELYAPPPPPPKTEDPPPTPPRPKPPPVKTAEVKLPPKPTAPPPSNDAPTPEPTRPVPVVVGISLSSTTAQGGFAVQVGNTTYGKSSDSIVDPSQVKPYSGPRYVPPGGADTEPVVLGEVRVPYPEEARKREIEGSVRLKVTLDAEGTVQAVAVVSGPGHGLDEAARDALRRFHFKPATQGGEAVGYTFIYTYTFLLD